MQQKQGWKWEEFISFKIKKIDIFLIVTQMKG